MLSLTSDKVNYTEMDKATATLKGWPFFPESGYTFYSTPLGNNTIKKSPLIRTVNGKAFLTHVRSPVLPYRVDGHFIAGQIGGGCELDMCFGPSYPHFGTFRLTADVYHPWVDGQHIHIEGPEITVVPRPDMENYRADYQLLDTLYKAVCDKGVELTNTLHPNDAEAWKNSCGGFSLKREVYVPAYRTIDDVKHLENSLPWAQGFTKDERNQRACLTVEAKPPFSGTAKACTPTNTKTDVDVTITGWKPPPFDPRFANKRLEEELDRHISAHQDVFQAYGLTATSVWGKERDLNWPGMPEEPHYPEHLWTVDGKLWQTRQQIQGIPLEATMRSDRTFCIRLLDRHLLDEPAGGCDIDTQNGTSLEPRKANPRARYPAIDEKSDLAIFPSNVQGVRTISEQADHIAILPKRETYDVPSTEIAEAATLPLDARIQTEHTPPWPGDAHMVVNWKADGSLALRYILSWGGDSRYQNPLDAARLAPSVIFQETGNTCTQDFIARTPNQACWIDVVLPSGWEGPLLGHVLITWEGTEQSRFFGVSARENPDVRSGFVYLGSPLLQAEPWPQGGYTATLKLRNTGTIPRQLALTPQANETALSAVHLLDRTCQEGVVHPGEVCTQRVFIQTPAWQPVRYMPQGVGLDMGMAPQGVLIRPEDAGNPNPLNPMLFVGDQCPKPGERASVWASTEVAANMANFLRSGEATRVRTQTCTWQLLFSAPGMDVLTCEGQSTFETLRLPIAEEVTQANNTLAEPASEGFFIIKPSAKPSLKATDLDEVSQFPPFDENGNPRFDNYGNPYPGYQYTPKTTKKSYENTTNPAMMDFDDKDGKTAIKPPSDESYFYLESEPTTDAETTAQPAEEYSDQGCKPEVCENSLSKGNQTSSPTKLNSFEGQRTVDTTNAGTNNHVTYQKHDLVPAQPGMDHPLADAITSEYMLESAATVDVERTGVLPLSCVDGRISNGWISNAPLMETSP